MHGEALVLHPAFCCFCAGPPAASPVAAAPNWSEQVSASTSGTTEDDTLSYFAKLAEEE